MNLWSNKTSVPSQSFSEICFHDNRMECKEIYQKSFISNNHLELRW